MTARGDRPEPYSWILINGSWFLLVDRAGRTGAKRHTARSADSGTRGCLGMTSIQWGRMALQAAFRCVVRGHHVVTAEWNTIRLPLGCGS